jgi:hypothetical protein
MEIQNTLDYEEFMNAAVALADRVHNGYELRGRDGSIMEAALQKSNHVVFYRVNEPVLFRDASGPAAF